MRKADYAILASIIGMHLRILKPLQDGNDPASKHLREVAREFAARAGVDRDAFLRACDLKP